MLRPYQVIGSQFLASRKRALLADDMGLGKSAQAIEACRRVSKPHGRYFHVGVVCPASVKENWQREFKRFWPEYDDVFRGSKTEAGGSVAVESFDKVRAGCWETTGFHVLIIDEAHYLKSRDSKRTTAIFGEGCNEKLGALIKDVPYVFCLSGTPTPNNNAELWPMLRALAPELILGKNGKPMNYWQFAMKYCDVVDNGFGMQIKGNRNTEELRARIAPFVLRRKKADVLKDLPAVTFDTLPLTNEIAAKALRDVERSEDAERVRSALDGGIDLAGLAPGSVATLRRLTGIAKMYAVVSWVVDWLDGGGDKLVVFAHHREVIEGIASEIAPGVAVWITGNTPASARQKAIDAFQNNPGVKIFIGQIQAAGTGITLTAASEVLFAESSWVPSENMQAAARIHRIGQKNACLVRFATLAGSLDERIQMVAAKKAREVAELFD